MPNGNFRTHPQCLNPEAARLRLQQLNVPRRTGTRSATEDSEPAVYERLKQVDWKTTLEQTGLFKDILESANNIAKRAAGLKAFQKKYYSFLFDNVQKNRAGDFRGIVVSAKWRKYFGRLGKFGGALSIAGIPLEAAELSWTDLSAKGVSANVMTTLARSGVGSVTGTGFLIAQGVSGGIHQAGQAAERFGYRETANDLKLFSLRMEDMINETQEAIDRTLSVENSRDVLTWDRSSINPRNWGLIVEGVQALYEELTAETQPLCDSVTRCLEQ